MSKAKDKARLKTNKELLELHQRCITTFLTQRNVRPKAQRKFFQLYDYYVDEDNIKDFFHKPIKVFIKALVKNQLNDIRDYGRK